MTLLEASWHRAWTGLGARGDGAATCLALQQRYGEPHRAYHTLQHLRECLAAFESVRMLAQRPHEVEMALWFHDAVYEVRRSDNEAVSADWARAVLLEAGVPAEAADRVHALVLATRHAVAPTDADEMLLVDIDLGILGADEARFAEYELQIRQEYRHVPGWLFRRKRREVLRSFLDRPRLYGTAHFHGRLEERARANLRRAIG